MSLDKEHSNLLDEFLDKFGTEQYWKLFGALPHIFKPDSDRARVLVVVSMIENQLELLLRAWFMRTPGITEKDCDFFLSWKKPQPPIGSLVVKARLAMILGLIPRPLVNSIKYIASVRNQCAHHQVSPPITDEMGEKLFGYFDNSLKTELAKMKVQWNEKVTEYPLGKFPQTLFILGCLVVWDEVASAFHRIVPARKIEKGKLFQLWARAEATKPDDGQSPVGNT